jgi:hypothetical protein
VHCELEVHVIINSKENFGGNSMKNLDKGPDPRFKLVIIFAALGVVFLLASIIVGSLS